MSRNKRAFVAPGGGGDEDAGEMLYTQKQREQRRIRPVDRMSYNTKRRTDTALGEVFRGRWSGVRPGEEAKYVHLFPLLGGTPMCPRNVRDLRFDAGVVVAMTLAHLRVPLPTALFVAARDYENVLVHEMVAAYIVDVGWHSADNGRLQRATREAVERGESVPLYRVRRRVNGTLVRVPDTGAEMDERTTTAPSADEVSQSEQPPPVPALEISLHSSGDDSALPFRVPGADDPWVGASMLRDESAPF